MRQQNHSFVTASQSDFMQFQSTFLHVNSNRTDSFIANTVFIDYREFIMCHNKGENKLILKTVFFMI